MSKVEYEKVNEPLVDKLERAEKSYRAGRLDPVRYTGVVFSRVFVASQLHEISDRIRKSHTERVGN